MKHNRKFAITITCMLMTVVMLALPLMASAAPADISLYEGQENSKVTILQKKLAEKGYFFCEPTGYFGSITETAVRNFQKMNGLYVDGIAGAVTLTKLFGEDYADAFTVSTSSSAISEDADSSYWDNARKEYPDALLLGDQNDRVASMQKRLKELGYFTYSSATGYYGSITLKAVRNFQSANGCTVDGIVGPATLAKLNSNKAISADKASQKSSSMTSVSTSSENSDAQKLIAFARKQIGKPYVYGAEGPNSFDCSGLVQYCFKQVFGTKVPRTAHSQGTNTNWTKITSRSNLQVGDLVFFGTGRTGTGIDHVGIYIGNGQMLHAPGTGKSVCITSINTSYYTSRFVCGRRWF